METENILSFKQGKSDREAAFDRDLEAGLRAIPGEGTEAIQQRVKFLVDLVSKRMPERLPELLQSAQEEFDRVEGEGPRYRTLSHRLSFSI